MAKPARVGVEIGVAVVGLQPVVQPSRVRGIPLVPSGPGLMPTTWCTARPPSSKPTADAAMYSRQTRARREPTSSTASSQLASRFATYWRSVQA